MEETKIEFLSGHRYEWCDQLLTRTIYVDFKMVPLQSICAFHIKCLHVYMYMAIYRTLHICPQFYCLHIANRLHGISIKNFCLGTVNCSGVRVKCVYSWKFVYVSASKVPTYILDGPSGRKMDFHGHIQRTHVIRRIQIPTILYYTVYVYIYMYIRLFL